MEIPNPHFERTHGKDEEIIRQGQGREWARPIGLEVRRYSTERRGLAGLGQRCSTNVSSYLHLRKGSVSILKGRPGIRLLLYEGGRRPVPWLLRFVSQ